MDLADADIAIGVDDGTDSARTARNDLCLPVDRLNLCPLQHGLHDGTIAARSRGDHKRRMYW